ncbi:hypothetical protein BDV11DRAFT_170 [Aspergillus similis]
MTLCMTIPILGTASYIWRPTRGQWLESNCQSDASEEASSSTCHKGGSPVIVMFQQNCRLELSARHWTRTCIRASENRPLTPET